MKAIDGKILRGSIFPWLIGWLVGWLVVWLLGRNAGLIPDLLWLSAILGSHYTLDPQDFYRSQKPYKMADTGPPDPLTLL